jgi:hypothetical protein
VSGDPLRILSLGGGTQSCALALMSARGDLPRLDHVVFADTQGELPETYEYLAWLSSRLHEAGIPMSVVTAGSLYDALMSSEPTSHNPTPPAHVVNPDGTPGRINQYRCSYDYKRRQIERKVKQLCGSPDGWTRGPRGAWKRSTVEQWIGFSSDEVGRCKPSLECRCGHPRARHTSGGCGDQAVPRPCRCARFDAWQVNRWPLIELGMRRGDTIRWFAEHGYPTPPRSACWFCPNSGNDRWRALRARGDDLFERACVLDDTIRHGGGFNARGNTPFAGSLYLHAQRVPLRVADLRTDQQRRDEDDGQAPLFDADALAYDCNAGVCFT